MSASASDLAARLAAVHERIAAACGATGRDPASVELLAVSKTRPAADVRAALAAGQTAFGENRIQELVAKAEELAGTGARWHQIGPVQTNKARALCGVADLELIHSLDRPKLVAKLAELADELGRSLAVLIQVHATDEETKHGARPEDVTALAREVVASGSLELRGLMAMGPREGDPAPVFASVAALRDRLRDALGLPLPVLSMGMTGDLEAAVTAGSTLVRVGTGVFGPRATPPGVE